MKDDNKPGIIGSWTFAIGAWIVLCVVGAIYQYTSINSEQGDTSETAALSDELQQLSQDIAVNARETVQGNEATFIQLEQNVTDFQQRLTQLGAEGAEAQVDLIKTRWSTVEQSALSLIATGPRLVSIREISNNLEENIKPMQSEFASVVDILRDEGVNSSTIIAGQRPLWLTERIARNIDKILEGGSESQAAADEFRTDASSLLRILQSLGEGDRVLGIQRVTDQDAIDSLNIASNLFGIVSSSITEIAGATTELQEAAASREAIINDTTALSGAIAALMPAIEQQKSEALSTKRTWLTVFSVMAVFGIALLFIANTSQQRRAKDTDEGVDHINSGLAKIASGDLTVEVDESNVVTSDIAKGINASTRQQRELIRNIQTPFEVSISEIEHIGETAREQVEIGKELTRSVVESVTAANEMAQNSESIKDATVEAAKASERSSEQVAVGYELTKEMSKSSADVREAVQETSKSAKRQGELIQSVTTAAEYIQSLNTKISVVAINTRIEAEKAGEYGRPFLAIAEAIGDLLTEAEEEGRKIISEVRLLQSMSAENLDSMENTVGTVVTILEYIERLDTSLEEINAGSKAITEVIKSVDDAAGQSAKTAQYVNNAMAQISDRNIDISEFSENTQVGVSNLQQSMRVVADNLSLFRIGDDKDSSEMTSSIAPESDSEEPADELEQFKQETESELAEMIAEEFPESADEMSDDMAADLEEQFSEQQAELANYETEIDEQSVDGSDEDSAEDKRVAS